MTYVVLGGR